jgi:hypothetical protein
VEVAFPDDNPILFVSRTPDAVTDDAVGLQGGCWTIRYSPQANRLAHLNLLTAPLKSSQRVYLVRSASVTDIPRSLGRYRFVPLSASRAAAGLYNIERELPAGRAEVRLFSAAALMPAAGIKAINSRSFFPRLGPHLPLFVLPEFGSR